LKNIKKVIKVGSCCYASLFELKVNMLIMEMKYFLNINAVKRKWVWQNFLV